MCNFGICHYVNNTLFQSYKFWRVDSCNENELSNKVATIQAIIAMALCSKDSEGTIKLVKLIETEKRVRYGDVPSQ